MHVRNLAELALGSRLRLLSDRLFEGVELVYQKQNTGIEARWFLFLSALQARGESSVSELADELGQTHAAVSQLSKKLIEKGLIQQRAGSDKRKSMLQLSAEGERQFAAMQPLLRSVREAVREIVAQTGYPLMDALVAFDAELDRTPIHQRILAVHARRNDAIVEIVPFQPALRDAFYQLNAEWLNRYYSIETIDHQVLSQPETQILEPGGAIFFALQDGNAVGTCALLQQSPGVFELSKMAVTEYCQGLGIGRRLLSAAIAEFKARTGTRLFLESESKLHAALHLYQSMGFVHQLKPDGASHYQRANVYMVYQPENNVATETPSHERT